MARYKERKQKIFQPRKEKLLEKQRAKEEAERKQRQQRLNLVSSITELGGPWLIRKAHLESASYFLSRRLLNTRQKSWNLTSFRKLSLKMKVDSPTGVQMNMSKACRKKKLVKKLRDARQKVMINKSKAMLPQFQDNPLLLVEKRVMHNCIEDGSEQAEWFNAIVLRLAEDIPDGANAIDAEYIIKYNIDEDEDEWTMPLLKDLKKGDLIVL